ncbi:DUF1810 domain-containing protein [Pedobacter changchengzhani]|uniref:DUF1810 domain-containing protein n=1 Tax=Pedobacter changchengzhani TaxID=2529274 RepID=A0A4R5MMJ7_9SPHI|nr:DUF1810 domain-containing protein [Pedobacter changchengzhani]TDG36970.1 DUF1810 domain-containing protein [Pedobacter changchengzhani]
MNDHFNLDRFVIAQQTNYQTALTEVKNGKKESHWMWYIFPQISGLGRSNHAVLYAIRNLDEAIAYLNHPILGKRLLEITNALLALNEIHPSEIFGSLDNEKLKSSMTLFAKTPYADAVFTKVLAKFYKGEMDKKTVEILNRRN